MTSQTIFLRLVILRLLRMYNTYIWYMLFCDVMIGCVVLFSNNTFGLLYQSNIVVWSTLRTEG